jgi:hypothetical protein
VAARSGPATLGGATAGSAASIPSRQATAPTVRVPMCEVLLAGLPEEIVADREGLAQRWGRVSQPYFQTFT